VHRDLKPSNAMLLAQERDFVKILDFGLAKSVGTAEASPVTATGTLMGTPAYISPELVLGQPCDGRADLYSLGVMLYLLGSGRLPFESSSPHEMLARHGTEPAPAMTGVPPALAEVIDRLLRKNPAERYPTAAATREALERALTEIGMGLTLSQEPHAAGEKTAVIATLRCAAMSHHNGDYTPGEREDVAVPGGSRTNIEGPFFADCPRARPWSASPRTSSPRATCSTRSRSTARASTRPAPPPGSPRGSPSSRPAPSPPTPRSAAKAACSSASSPGAAATCGGSAVNEGDAGVGAILIPGTPSTATYNGSVYNYRMRVEPSQGGGDDTALNAVQLLCKDPSTGATEWISSYDGIWGNWYASATCGGSGPYLMGARMRIESSQGGGDDTAANNVTFSCTDSSTIQAPGGQGWGSWLGWTSCPAQSAVCGLSSRFEASQGSGDDTAMNSLELFVAVCDLAEVWTGRHPTRRHHPGHL
jgi:hypothetical protein